MWLERVVLNPTVHRPLPLPRCLFGGRRPTVNTKDVLISTLLILLFWICWRINVLVALAYLALMMKFEPALLLFPYNVCLSVWCWKSPAVWTDEIRTLLPALDTLLAADTFSAIRSELASIRHAAPLIDEVLPAQRDIGSPAWRLMPLKTLTQTHEATMRHTPRLAAFVSSHPEIVTAFFSSLAPGGTIPTHSGYCKGILRVHIGICTPEPDLVHLTLHTGAPDGAGDASVKLKWHQGKAIAFDDTYLHSVEHRGTKPRDVLWMDIVRPEVRSNPFLLWMTRHVLTWIAQSSWMQEVDRRVERVVFVVPPPSSSSSI